MITEKRLKKIKAVAAARNQAVVVLEDMHDPHNAAAVLRTCDAFGIQRVCFIFDKGEKFNPKKIGKAASSSANKWLDFEVFDSAKKCFAKLKRQGYTIVATVLDKKAKSLFKTKFTNPKIALAFGNEHSGLSSEAVKLSDIHIYIPMRGFVQSLNLSITAAICLYEMIRQAKKSGKFLLDEKAQKQLAKSWSSR